MKINILFFLILLIFVSACGDKKSANNDLAKSISQGSVKDIKKRSGTLIRDNDKALADAERRLKTGGGLFGKKPMDLRTMLQPNEGKNQIASVGMPINAILWRSSLEVIEFMPIASADPFGGIIITDWYSSNNPKERCKLNIFIKGLDLKSSNLKVNTFCQKFNQGIWLDKENNNENGRRIENAILNKAKKIKLTIN